MRYDASKIIKVGSTKIIPALDIIESALGTTGSDVYVSFPPLHDNPEHLHSEIRALSGNTEDLNLRGWPLTTLNGVSLPKKLKWLNLSFTKLTSLDGIKLPAGLQVLNLSHTPISSLEDTRLPDGIETLSLDCTRISSLTNVIFPQKLKSLNLSGTNLTSLADVTFPQGLLSLNLSNLDITNLCGVLLPEKLRQLIIRESSIHTLAGVTLPPTLSELYLNGAPLFTLSGVVLPESMNVLDLSYTSLVNLCDVFLPSNLRSLSLAGTYINHLNLVELPSGLTSLFLDNTDISQLPECLRELTNLETLGLSELELEELPDWLLELNLPFTREEYGKGIRLHNTTVAGVDMSIFDQSQEAILQWFEERKQARLAAEAGSVIEEADKPLNELKVVFLGDGEAGKTHTIARLLNDGKQVKKFRESSTPGIVIEDKTYSIGDRDVKVHFWDFGGQEILHSMHRMFLTTNTLYVVVLNVREGNQDDRARYWLHNLKSFADGAPVLLVLNKMDMNKNASVNESDLRKLYPGLTEIVKLSTLKDSEAEFKRKFQNVLLEQIGKMKILEQPLVAAGRRVKEKIQNMKENYIHGDVFRKFCDDCGVKGTDTIRRGLLETFGQLGVSFFYRGKMELEQHVVLKPDWITNAIYIILFNKVHAVTNGLVSHDTIYEMLSSQDTENIRRTVTDATYTRDEVNYVLEVFRKFRLSFQVSDEKEEHKVEFLPMLCDANSTPEAMKYENDPDALEFRMHYEYLPPNVIHRLMVERRNELDQNNVWLSGARFVYGDTGRSAVVKSEGSNLLRIFVRAEKEPRDPQRYLDDLKGHLGRINTEMGLTVSRQEVIYKENGTEESFDYNWLLRNQEHGVPEILSMVQNKWILLTKVLVQSDFPEDERQITLRDELCQACKMLQDRKIYWKANEDERTDYLMDFLTAKNYVVQGQKRVGISAGGIQSGELDLDIRRNPGDPWTALEALNLTGSSATQIEYWDAHLKKLLDNYNHVGRSFLFHVSYVQCKKERFSKVCSDLYEHLRFYSPDDFEVQQNFVQNLPMGDRMHEDGFLRVVKSVYDCGGNMMVVYHYFVRIGE